VQVAGVVGRAHGLDGSFYVTRPRVDLLTVGGALTVAGDAVTIERRAGTDARPILRVSGCSGRSAAEALRGQQLLIADVEAPPLGPDEYRAEDLEGARVVDGADELGVVRRLIALPSCECLSVERADGGPDLLVPLVRDAIREVDPKRARIEVNLAFLGEAP
jgi:16S rRNA processing protein RimM